MVPVIQTFTGRRVNPLNLRPSDVSIVDIAHHLACINRFVGALRKPVSVGQHSVYVCRLMLGTSWQREALFHDASEAYLGDVSRWVKHDPMMEAYREAEDRCWRTICIALGLRYVAGTGLDPSVKKADDLMVRYEALRLSDRHHAMFELADFPPPTTEEIKRVGPWRPWGWEASKENFLAQARALGYYA